MVQEMARVRRRRMNAHGMILRRQRIFARLREGLSYEEIATEEGVTGSRIRQIVSEVLQKRAIDSGADHAKLQLDRLAPVMQVAAEAVAAGDVSAIAPYLKVLDRLDRYQTAAGAHQVYDDEARKKLLDKINRVAANLGVDEAYRAAAIAHLKKQGEIVHDADDAHGLEAETASLEEEKNDRASAWDFALSP
jgi:DNA-binding CsgD family transcriptional regulator